ncbi:hypothetical protein P175DRAFT_0554797 [Aspergillus ochraceoroseus IBT 24754]|uniref:Uncharacterized protein n=1 Tax=Aspergillus ochraceoroseus IBT 24754 TaxID=1392256 RepID=A0A2T5MAK1_9EURO|nr:uncharacterized protein P175DRAFT_0554797 [Aspergillus ochraceoroseus IBT 24754]PTU25563.1 hypothetical protein P175DRAFT_0554797 [Aspergillus ochraceoroseus IBT 24754]
MIYQTMVRPERPPSTRIRNIKENNTEGGGRKFRKKRKTILALINLAYLSGMSSARLLYSYLSMVKPKSLDLICLEATKQSNYHMCATI